MKAALHPIPRILPQGTYVELVTSLCGTRTPAIVMTALFVLVATATVRASHDACLAVLALLGLLASAARLAVLVGGRRRCDAAEMTPAAARRFERSFTLGYVGFAGLFGLFAARALMLPLGEWRMPVVILVVGYAAGAAATVALRPRIVVWSMSLSVTPPSAILLLNGDNSASASAACLLALLAGGLRSVGQRYRSQATKTTKRQDCARLARTDPLTGLGNRIALKEAFDTLERSGVAIGVHYIDLDDFKPVNDRLGHHAGDVVLCRVAARLRSCCRPGDIAVRLGGDEFVYLQADAPTPSDLATQAARIENALSAPYDIDGRHVTVGASIGSSRHLRGSGMDALLATADDALRLRKHQRKTTLAADTHTPHARSADSAQATSRAA